MAAMHGPTDMLNDAGDFEEVHELETFAQEFIEHERNDCEEKATSSEHQELLPMNIMNITGIVSNDQRSIGTIPWTPPMQPSSS